MRAFAAVALAALAAIPVASAQPFSGRPQPSSVANSFRVVARTPDGTQLRSWRGQFRYAERPGARLGPRETLVERGNARIFAQQPGDDGGVERRIFQPRPDGFSFVDFLSRYVESILAQSRGGRRTLTPTTIRGIPAWSTTVRLRPNDCAGLRGGSATVAFSRVRLLPLSVVETRAGRRRTFSYAYRNVNAALPESDFSTPSLGPRPFQQDFGFRRASRAASRAHLSYPPELPTLLPPGFSLAVSGWAPRSNITGPEGSIPAKREFFGAVYRRGLERIDFTQRLRGSRGWISDPFGGECLFELTERVTVRGVTGTYGIGTDIEPHLYWRQGRVLYTLSGPFPRRDLVAIANSLAP